MSTKALQTSTTTNDRLFTKCRIQKRKTSEAKIPACDTCSIFFRRNQPDAEEHQNSNSKSNSRIPDIFALGLCEQSRIASIQSSISATFPEESSPPESATLCTLLPGDRSQLLRLIQSYTDRLMSLANRTEPLPGLAKLDQISILHGYFYELLTIRFGFAFDSCRDGFPLIENDLIKQQSSIVFHPLAKLSEPKQAHIVDNCRSLLNSLNAELENDLAMRNLLMIHFLYQPRDKLTCPEVIRYHFYATKHLLTRHLEHKYRNLVKATRKYRQLTALVNDAWILREYFSALFAQQ